MKIILTSDTHERHRALPLPLVRGEVDVLVVAGDFTLEGGESYVRDFNEWLGEVPIKHRVIIPGNHELTFDPIKNGERFHEYRQMITNAHLLINSNIVINGVNFYGIPDTPFFCDWAFNRSPEQMDLVADLAIESHKKLPIDVLVTHGPPHGILDGVWRVIRDTKTYQITGRYQEHTGCKAILRAVEQIKPKIHVFGHIHSGYGNMQIAGTTFYNASFVNEKYMPKYNPFIVEI